MTLPPLYSEPDCRLGDRARGRLVRGDRQHGFVAEHVAGIVADDGAEARAVVGRGGDDRVVLRRCAGDVDAVALPLIAERRRARCAHAERHRRARRDRLARRVRGDARRTRRVRDPIDDAGRGTRSAREVVQAAVAADLEIDGRRNAARKWHDACCPPPDRACGSSRRSSRRRSSRSGTRLETGESRARRTRRR